MNIAVIGKDNHLKWDTSVAKYFKKLGHNVIHFQINRKNLYSNLLKFYNKQLSDKLHSEYIYKSLLNFKPDIVFFVSTFFIPLEYYKKAKELPQKPKIISWDGDAGLRFEQNSSYLKYIDILFSSTSSFTNTTTNGFENIHFLPFAVDIDIFKNSYKNDIDKIYFCAAYTEERCQLVNTFDHNQITIKGWGWDKCNFNKNLELKNKKIYLNELANDYNKYAITLNLHQTHFSKIAGVNMRTFEASACGSVVLCDNRKDMEVCYEKNKEILIYNSFEEAKELADIYLNDKKKREMISNNSYTRTIAHHTYTIRLKEALDIIRQY